jgi:hypothetical protein
LVCNDRFLYPCKINFFPIPRFLDQGMYLWFSCSKEASPHTHLLTWKTAFPNLFEPTMGGNYCRCINFIFYNMYFKNIYKFIPNYGVKISFLINYYGFHPIIITRHLTMFFWIRHLTMLFIINCLYRQMTWQNIWFALNY